MKTPGTIGSTAFIHLDVPLMSCYALQVRGAHLCTLGARACGKRSGVAHYTPRY